MTRETFITWILNFDPHLLQNEDDVETKFVIPLFTHLGYPEACYRGKYPIKTYKPGRQGRKPETDRIYFSVGNPDEQDSHTSLILIEAKEPQKKNLDEDVAQAKFYGYHLTPPFLVVTNGYHLKVIRRYAYREEMLFDCTVEELHDEATATAFYNQLHFETVKRIKEYTVNIPEPIPADDYAPPVPLNFVGREHELAQLYEALQHNNIIVIGGIAGMGKTYLVAQFVQRLRETHPIIWLECQPHLQLEQFFTGFAQYMTTHFDDPGVFDVLRLPTSDQTQRAKAFVDAVNRHVCLLIWDSFDQQDNSSFLPLLELCSRQLQQGKLLITTRQWAHTEEYDWFNVPSVLPPLYRLDEEAGIRLMQQLGISNVSSEILSQAYHRVDGHPKFLTMLVGLAKKFPLPSLLNELPYVPEKVYNYIQQKVFDTLELHPKHLLEKLSMLRVPFQTSVIEHLMPSSVGYEAFDILLNRFLVTRQSQETLYYEIHDVVKEFSQTHIAESDLPEIHKQLYAYYKALPEKRYADEYERIYHALNADMLDEAKDASNHLLGAAQYVGAYDLILDCTLELLKVEPVREWSFLHHIRGRALRFKQQFTEALDAYQSAMDFAQSVQEQEAAKMEIASILAYPSKQSGGPDLGRATKYYNELSQSSTLETKIMALSVLGDLNVRKGKKEGITQLKETLALAQNAHLPSRHISYIYHSLGLAYRTLHHDTKQAIQYFEQSLALQENLEDFGAVNPEAWYATHSSLAELYSETGRFHEAVKANRECVEIDRKLGFEKRLARSLHFLGRELCKSENYQEAKDSLLESLSLAEKSDEKDYLTRVKRVNLEWLTVACWYVGEYEQAMEYGFDYVKLCEKEGMIPNPHPVFLEASLLPTFNISEFYQKGSHILVLPSSYNSNHLAAWKRNIDKRRPDLAAFSILPFQKVEESHTRRRRVKIGRNEPCPCGSGKKYKHCCGR
jgi:tetratricopeptide (TPR) repeat protein